MSPAIGKDELTKMINDVFSSKDQLEKENEKLEGEIKKIKKEKVKLDNNVFILNANKEKFEKENKDLKAQNGKIEEKKKRLEDDIVQLIDKIKELEKRNPQTEKKVDETENLSTDNPWIVESIYEFQFYNCPTCSYKHYSKQEFVNHSFNTHLDSVNELQNISDGSLSDIVIPWDNSNDFIFDNISNNELKDNNIDDVMEIQVIPNQVVHENEIENIINQKCAYCDKIYTSSQSLEYHIDQFHDKHTINEGNKENHTINENIITEIGQSNLGGSLEIKIDDYSKNDEIDDNTNDDIMETQEAQNPVNVDISELNNFGHNNKSISINSCPQKIELPIFRKQVIEKKCTKCDKSFSDIHNMEFHVNKVHGGHKCDICCKTFSTEETLWKHKSNVKNCLGYLYKCKQCSETFLEYDFFNTHMSKVHEGSQMKLASEENLKTKCPYCGKKIWSGGSGRGSNHVTKCPLRPKKPTFFCYICFQPFDKNEGLKEHLIIIHSNHNHGYDSSKLKDAKVQDNESENKDNDKVTDDDDVGKKDFEPEKINDIMQVEDEFTNEEVELKISDKRKAILIHEPNSNKQKLNRSIHYSYGCDICGKSFKTTRILRNHIKSRHEGQSIYQCKSCGKCFTVSGSLKNHVNIIHGGLKKFKCDSCTKSYNHSIDLKRHIKIIHEGIRNYMCVSCGKTFTTSGSLKIHSSTHERPERQYNCKSCDKSFDKTGDLNDHIKTVHKVSKPFNCDICARVSFQSELELEEHKNATHNCNLCDKTFRYKEEVTIHKHMDHKNDYKGDYKCSYCGKLFFYQKNFNRHILIEHEGQKCTYCKEKFQKFFSSEKELKYHISRHHQCHLCEKILVSRKSVAEHIKSVHDKIKDKQCTLCGKSYFSSSKLNHHITHVHIAIRSHECKTCGKKFVQPSELKRHIRVVHEGIKNHHCTHKGCGKSFTEKTYFNQHVKCHAVKETLCQMCGSAFRNEEKLNKHVRIIHEGKKDYKCDECGELFAYESTMKNHKNKIHYRKFVCHSCDKPFVENSGLQQHLQNVHEGRRDHICEVCGKTFSQKGDRDRHIKKYHSDKSLNLL